MSLRKDIEALKIGESMTIKGPRAAAYTAASRARVFISTKETEDGWTVITRKEPTEDDPFKTVVRPEIGVKLAVLTLRDLPTSQRLEVFSEFELCCGMNLGECTCPDEEIVVNDRVISEQDEKLDRAKAIMAQFEENEGKLPGIPVVSEEIWEFTQDKPTHNDDGRWYRYQYLVSSPKKRRMVRVDEDNYQVVTKIF